MIFIIRGLSDPGVDGTMPFCRRDEYGREYVRFGRVHYYFPMFFYVSWRHVRVCPMYRHMDFR